MLMPDGGRALQAFAAAGIKLAASTQSELERMASESKESRAAEAQFAALPSGVQALQQPHWSSSHKGTNRTLTDDRYGVSVTATNHALTRSEELIPAYPVYVELKIDHLQVVVLLWRLYCYSVFFAYPVEFALIGLSIYSLLPLLFFSAAAM